MNIFQRIFLCFLVTVAIVFGVNSSAYSDAARTNAVDASDAPFTQPGTGATPTDLQTRAESYIDVLADFIPAAQHAAIKAYTSTYDATDDIQNAINASFGTGTLSSNKVLFLTGGKYQVDELYLWKHESLGAGTFTVNGATDTYTCGTCSFTTHIEANQYVVFSGFSNANNNGFKKVSAVGATTITVTDTNVTNETGGGDEEVKGYDAANSQQGGVVIEGGRNVQIYGDNSGQNSLSLSNIINIGGANNSIKGIELYSTANRTTNGIGIFADPASLSTYLSLINVEVNSQPTDGIYSADIELADWKNVLAYDNGQYGVHIEGDTISGTLTNVRSIGNGDSGWYISDAFNLVLTNPQSINNLVTTCTAVEIAANNCVDQYEIDILGDSGGGFDTPGNGFLIINPDIERTSTSPTDIRGSSTAIHIKDGEGNHKIDGGYYNLLKSIISLENADNVEFFIGQIDGHAAENVDPIATIDSNSDGVRLLFNSTNWTNYVYTITDSATYTDIMDANVFLGTYDFTVGTLYSHKKEVVKTADATLSLLEMSDTVITNYGETDDADLILTGSDIDIWVPSFHFVYIIVASMAVNDTCFKAAPANFINFEGTSGGDNGCVCTDTPTIGNKLECWGITMGFMTMNWFCEGIRGAWAPVADGVGNCPN